MKLNQMTKEEIELLSYTDLTYLLLTEHKKSMNTPTIFRKISDLLEYSEDEYTAKIGDYYTSLTIDKRFVLLDNNEWDIRDRHSVELVVDDDEEITDEEVEEIVEEPASIPVEEEDEDIDAIDDDESLEEESDLDELSIIPDDDDEEES
jgi:DNA-directed RNA polymerase subunit delta